MLTRTTLALLACCVVAASTADAQTTPLDVYLAGERMQTAIRTLTSPTAADTLSGTRRDIVSDIMPLKNISGFVGYVLAKSPIISAADIEALRLNKILQTAAGSGGTSTLSSAIGPSLLGAAIEYGGVLQETTGTTTTLRGNVLGLARLVAGEQQFPYCPAADPQSCHVWSRRLRRFSTAVSLEQTSPAAEKAATATSTVNDLLGSSYRVSTVGAKVELSGGGHADDPAYVQRWRSAMATLQRAGLAEELTAAFSDLFGDQLELYREWEDHTRVRLNEATSAQQFRATLEERLAALDTALSAGDASYTAKVRVTAGALSSYRAVRDELLTQAQVRKSSLEWTHRSPLNQPATSNLRFIYSHQPSTAAVIYTLNAAATIYEGDQGEVSPWRDLQLAAQLDRKFGEASSPRSPVLTLAAYYQWMRSDARVTFGDAAAGSIPGLALADGADTVLGTSGHIVVVQGKLAVPLNEVVKVPFSMTYSNRRELIPEKNTWRGQIGLSIDMDGLFK